MSASSPLGPLPKPRSILVHGLGLVLRDPRPLLWTYAANLGLALIFSAGLHARLADLLDHSLAAERLNAAFDLGTLGEALLRLQHHAPATGAANYLGIVLYVALYFVLVPGTLFCYGSAAPCRLAILLGMGLNFFWRFVRITLLTLLASLLVLAPLLAAQAAWSQWVDEHVVGWGVFYDKLPGLILILLVAALLRLYFDLVEVYTVQLNHHLRPSGRTDRRVRTVLLPAWRTLRAHFGSVYLSWLALLLVGFAALLALSRIALHTLAQPRVWPMFLLTQLGLLLTLTTRFWQRAAESVLAMDHPLPREEAVFDPVLDLQPDPEPAAPSLSAPDPGIYEGPALP